MAAFNTLLPGLSRSQRASPRAQAGFANFGLMRALFGRRRFSIAQLFANGEQGGWWDPSDFSTQFQDSAGTTPVTAVGQPVGRILDKSGRGNHLIQATTPARATLQQDANGFYYWATDGTDDYWQSAAAFNMSASDKVLIVAGVTKTTSKSGSFICETSANSSINAGAFGLDLNGFAANGDWPGAGIYGSAGPAASIKDGAGVTFAAGTSAVIGAYMDAAGGATAATQIAISKNGVDLGTGAVSGADTNGNLSAAHTLYVGARAGSLHLQGRIYQLVIRGGVTSPALFAAAQRAVGAKMGSAF